MYLKPDFLSKSVASQYIGFCGLRKNSQNSLVDIGYRIDQKYWVQGIATETAQAVLAYGFEHLNLNYQQSPSKQPASIDVSHKLGFSESGQEQEDGFTWLLFELKNSNWTKAHQK